MNSFFHSSVLSNPNAQSGGSPNCDTLYSTAWLDLSPVGVSKASGLAMVADELGVAQADVLAIGDGRNDIEMLRWAGRGVAMGQAVEEVKAAADAVTETVYDDGVVVELSRWWP